MYYVGFSTATIVASLILFQGFDTTNTTNTVSLLCGFVVTFFGVHLLDISRSAPVSDLQNGHIENGLMSRRMSLQPRASLDGWAEGTPRSAGGHGRRSSLYRAQTATLFNAFEEPDEDVAGPGRESVSLDRLREEDEEEDDANERTRILVATPQPRRPEVEALQRSGSAASRSKSNSPIDSSSSLVGNGNRISPRPGVPL